ncbi:MAG TPA: AI-2E family transporter [Gemmatimonadales bacterium]|jgi:predicted PurR-regulated permease PerM
MTVTPRSPRAPHTLRPRTLTHPEIWFAAGIFLILAMAALRLASAFFLPVAASALMSLLLAPLVRWLSRRGVPGGVAAGLVLLGLVVVAGGTLFTLARPAAAWLGRAPATMEQAQEKIQKVIAPIYSLQRTAAKVQEVTAAPTGKVRTEVEVAPAGMLSRVSGTTIGVFGAVSTVLFLTFFLLAAGERFSEKLGDIMPERHRREMIGALRDMQAQMSTYLSTSVLIRTGLGLATWGALKLIGLPNPALWGVMAAVLNFIPYLGSLVMLLIIAVASLVTFDDTEHVLLAVGAFFLISLLEGNVVTPMLLGHRLPLNAVAIFVGLLFWGWIWGITGAVLAVPLMVMIKVIADRVKVLEPLGVLLGS